MTRKSQREIRRAVDELTDSDGSVDEDVSLTDTQARAVREYTVHCEHPSELDDDLQAALLEVST